MSSELARVDRAKTTIRCPDGTTIDYEGPVDALDYVIRESRKHQSLWLVWRHADTLKLFALGLSIVVVVIWSLLWVNRPVETYRPQSISGASHEAA